MEVENLCENEAYLRNSLDFLKANAGAQKLYHMGSKRMSEDSTAQSYGLLGSSDTLHRDQSIEITENNIMRLRSHWEIEDELSPNKVAILSKKQMKLEQEFGEGSQLMPKFIR